MAMQRNHKILHYREHRDLWMDVKVVNTNWLKKKTIFLLQCSLRPFFFANFRMVEIVFFVSLLTCLGLAFNITEDFNLVKTLVIIVSTVNVFHSYFSNHMALHSRFTRYLSIDHYCNSLHSNYSNLGAVIWPTLYFEGDFAIQLFVNVLHCSVLSVWRSEVCWFYFFICFCYPVVWPNGNIIFYLSVPFDQCHKNYYQLSVRVNTRFDIFLRLSRIRLHFFSFFFSKETSKISNEAVFTTAIMWP